VSVTQGSLQIGPYVIESVLGQGGMGAVLAGHHEELGRRAAIKVLLEDFSSADAKERFQREREAIALLNHPGVVRAYESGFQGESP
jgi:serine/threonine protein kinase